MQSALAIGTTLGGFTIEAVVGQGATGVVYRARDAAGQVVAVKVLNATLAADDRFRRRFLREAALAAELEHPHVVPVVATGDDAGVLFLAMAHVDGADLRTLIRAGGAFEPDRALMLLDGIADALDAAHAIGLVHRDVTPGNVLVGTADGHETAYLGDFGLARHASTPTSLTGERSFVGTIDYIAPEQIRGDELDGRADQYSLACVLYECLTGAQPFARDSDVATVFAHLNERPPGVVALAPDLPQAVDGVLARGLAKEPADRYADCRALVAATRDAVHGTPAAGGRRRVVVIAAAAAVLAGAVLATIAITGRDEPPGTTTNAVSTPAAPAPPALPLDADAVAFVDPAGRRVLGQSPLAGVADLLVGAGGVWALRDQESQLVRIDPRTGRPAMTVDLPFPPGGMAATATDVWVSEAGGPGVVSVAADSGEVAAPLAVTERAGEGTSIAVSDGSVWLGRGAAVLRIDPDSGRVIARFATPLGADLLAAADDAVWVASSADGRLFEIDAAANRIVARPKLHGFVTDLAVGGGSAWVTVTPEDRVYRLNPDDGSVQASFAAGPGPESVAFAGDAVIVANGRDDSLSRIDLATGERESLRTGASPMVVRADGGTAWIASVEPAATPIPLEDGNEVRVALTGDLGMDPATAPGPDHVRLFYQTCLRLQTYPDVAGAAGRVLAPDAAVANPTVSADGRTYEFTIRPGLRFSPPSGEAITAQTFAASIERALSPALGPAAQAGSLIDDVVGLDEYQSGSSAHVAGIVAAGDRLRITIEEPSGDFEARLALPFSCAVPAGTPIVQDGVGEPLPSGGPYHVASHGPGRTVLEVNPAYNGSRPHRPQRITYATGLQTARAIALLDAGEIDYVPYDYDTLGPLAQGGALDRQFGPGSGDEQRYFPSAAPGVDVIAFNTKRPLFRDVNLRRAVNAALDRPAIVAVWGDEPSDRYVPLAVLDSANGSAYSVTGPDLSRARSLANGATGDAVLYFCGAPENRRVVAIVRSNLAKIGIRVRPAPSLDCTLGRDPKIDDADLMLLSPVTPIVDPAPFVEAALGRERGIGEGSLPSGWFRDASLQREIDAARPLLGPDRIAAYAALQERLLDAVPFASLGSWTAPEYVSPRLGCRVFQGAYNSLDLAAACPQPPAG